MPLIFPHDGILTRRPDEFDLNTDSSLSKGLVFAGLGRFTGSTRYQDSSLYSNHGQLSASMNPATDWVFDAELGRWVLAFGGSESVNIPMAIPTLPFSVSFKMRRDTGATGHAALLDLGVASIFWYSGPGVFGVFPGVYDQSLDSITGIAQWYSVTYEFAEETNRNIYIDGDFFANFSTSWTPSAASLTLGAGEGFYFTGRISDLIIHNRALALPEIETLADRSDPMYGGLIQPLPRYFPVAVAAGGGADFSGAAVGTNGVTTSAATVRVSATGAASGVNGATSSTTTVLVSATGAAAGSNGVVSSVLTVGDVASFSGAASGANGVVSSSATVLVSAIGAATGENGTVSSAATVLVSATGTAVGINGVVVARIGAAATTSQGMMFMVC